MPACSLGLTGLILVPFCQRGALFVYKAALRVLSHLPGVMQDIQDTCGIEHDLKNDPEPCAGIQRKSCDLIPDADRKRIRH